MPFDVKELMVDITKVGMAPQFCYHYTIAACMNFTCFGVTLCGYTAFCPDPSINCGARATVCTVQGGACAFNTYTCFDTNLTCGGTRYCANTEPLPYGQGVSQEMLAAVKAQLQAALKEVEQHEQQLAATAKKEAKKK